MAYAEFGVALGMRCFLNWALSLSSLRFELWIMGNDFHPEVGEFLVND